MFEKAARMKLRFEFKGMCSVEDLWDLPAEDLDAMYGVLMAQARALETDSLLEAEKKKGEDVLGLQIAIIKHIVEVKLAERKIAQDEAANRQRKQRILEIIATKQDEALASKSVEELTGLLDELG